MSLPHDELLQQDSSYARQMAMLSTGYRDGYDQRANDGINHTRTEWQLNWVPLTKAESDDVLEFWELNGTVLEWDWLAPGDTEERTWRFENGVSVTNVADKYILSVPIREAF